jgi:hypothetical protein
MANAAEENFVVLRRLIVGREMIGVGEGVDTAEEMEKVARIGTVQSGLAMHCDSVGCTFLDSKFVEYLCVPEALVHRGVGRLRLPRTLASPEAVVFVDPGWENLDPSLVSFLPQARGFDIASKDQWHLSEETLLGFSREHHSRP